MQSSRIKSALLSTDLMENTKLHLLVSERSERAQSCSCSIEISDTYVYIYIYVAVHQVICA